MTLELCIEDEDRRDTSKDLFAVLCRKIDYRNVLDTLLCLIKAFKQYTSSR